MGFRWRVPLLALGRPALLRTGAPARDPRGHREVLTGSTYRPPPSPRSRPRPGRAAPQPCPCGSSLSGHRAGRLSDFHASPSAHRRAPATLRRVRLSGTSRARAPARRGSASLHQPPRRTAEWPAGRGHRSRPSPAPRGTFVPDENESGASGPRAPTPGCGGARPARPATFSKFTCLAPRTPRARTCRAGPSGGRARAAGGRGAGRAGPGAQWAPPGGRGGREGPTASGPLVWCCPGAECGGLAQTRRAPGAC